MSKFIKIWVAKSHKGFNHVLFHYGQDRKWLYHQNWKFNGGRFGSPKKVFFCNIITPLFRFTVCNGKTEIGLGNHFFEFGYSPAR